MQNVIYLFFFIWYQKSNFVPRKLKVINLLLSGRLEHFANHQYWKLKSELQGGNIQYVIRVYHLTFFFFLFIICDLTSYNELKSHHRLQHRWREARRSWARPSSVIFRLLVECRPSWGLKQGAVNAAYIWPGPSTHLYPPPTRYRGGTTLCWCDKSGFQHSRTSKLILVKFHIQFLTPRCKNIVNTQLLLHCVT